MATSRGSERVRRPSRGLDLSTRQRNLFAQMSRRHRAEPTELTVILTALKEIGRARSSRGRKLKETKLSLQI
jgi:hypothetical protein